MNRITCHCPCHLRSRWGNCSGCCTPHEVRRHLRNQGATLFGRAFDLSQESSFEECAEWLTRIIEAVDGPS